MHKANLVASNDSDRYSFRHAIELLESRRLFAADIELLKDINTHPVNLERFWPLVNMGDVAYFSADDGTHGYELWRTDGTPAGTQLVKDSNPGRGGLDLRSFERLGNSIYFAATTPAAGRELWTSDGTAQGTHLVTDLWPGNNGSYPSPMLGYGNKLYFTAMTPQLSALFETDGTAAGTKPVVGLVPDGWNLIDEFAHTVYQGHLYLSIGREQDGVLTTAMLRTDAVPGTGEIVGQGIRLAANGSAELDGSLYVASNVDDGSGELWKTDGVSDFVKVTTTQTFGAVSKLIAGGNRLYFVTGNQLWTSDGTDAGTQLLCDAVPESYVLTPVGNQLFFPRQLPDIGYELWVTDGTTGGTHLIKDIVEGPADSLSGVRFVVDGTLRFVSIENGVYRLWVSDGTEAGTFPLKTLALGEMGIGSGAEMLNSGLALIKMGTETQGYELWTSDGTAEGTVPMTTQLPMTHGANPSAFIQAGNLQFFTADDGDHGRELWTTDGTSAGTHLVKDLMPGLGNGMGKGTRFSDFEAAAVGNTLYFLGNDGVHGRELWKTDGTEAGTVMVKDFLPGADDGLNHPLFSTQLLDFNGILLFSARDQTDHYVLWRTDGTEAGTSMVSDKVAANWMHIVGDQVYFQGRGLGLDIPTGIYRTDGTPQGTVYVSDGVNAGLKYPTDLNGTVFFSSGGLWKSDGTPAGTVLVKDMFPGADSNVSFLVTWQGAVYFIARSADGDGLWKSDGTEAGTVQIKLLPPQIDHLPPSSLQVAGDHLFFYYDFKIWRSDGTDAGTVVIQSDVTVVREQFARKNGQVLFVVIDANGQQSLWGAGGSGGGENLGLPGALTDLAVLAASGNSFYVTASGPLGGGEIYVGRFSNPLPGDANGDGKVDLTDFGILKNNFGAGTTQAQGDFDGNGRVDLTDFGIFKQALATPGAALKLAAVDEALAALGLAMDAAHDEALV